MIAQRKGLFSFGISFSDYIFRNSRYTDVAVDIKGIHIPAHSHVDIPVHALHNDEEYWENPDKFMPER